MADTRLVQLHTWAAHKRGRYLGPRLAPAHRRTVGCCGAEVHRLPAREKDLRRSRGIWRHRALRIVCTW